MWEALMAESYKIWTVNLIWMSGNLAIMQIQPWAESWSLEPSGLLGTRLTQLLLERGHTVSYLWPVQKTRQYSSFTWDAEAGTMEPGSTSKYWCSDSSCRCRHCRWGLVCKTLKSWKQNEINSAAGKKNLTRPATRWRCLYRDRPSVLWDDVKRYPFTENDKPGADF